jgi:hypothetical protein
VGGREVQWNLDRLSSTVRFPNNADLSSRGLLLFLSSSLVAGLWAAEAVRDGGSAVHPPPRGCFVQEVWPAAFRAVGGRVELVIQVLGRWHLGGGPGVRPRRRRWQAAAPAVEEYGDSPKPVWAIALLHVHRWQAAETEVADSPLGFFVFSVSLRAVLHLCLVTCSLSTLLVVAVCVRCNLDFG